MKIRHPHPWKEMPFIRILPVFVSGIILYEQGLTPPVLIYTFISASLLTLLLFTCLSESMAWKYRVLRGIAIQLSILTTAPLFMLLHEFEKGPLIIQEESARRYYSILLLEPPEQKKNSFKTVALFGRIQNGKVNYEKRKAIIYFDKKDYPVEKLHYGSIIITNKNPGKINSATNPGGFNYKRWLADQGIFYQYYLRSPDISVLPVKSEHGLYRLVYSIRDGLLSILRKNITDKVACGLAEALLVGYRNDMDESLLLAYSNTGVIHVIAISGLHLGLIYIILMRISGMIFRGRSGKIFQPLTVISALWIFTLVSGASASVVRSAVMFSLLAIGNILGRKSSSMNSLAASAFLLLCYQPLWIRDVGFQLSYAAVGGILLFQKKIFGLYLFSNPIAIKFSEMIALTLAAQIFTAPLIILYFHQFPLLFLFTNLIAVPLSGLILSGELILCVLSLFPDIATIAGKWLEGLIGLLNQYILLMNNVPGTTIQQLYISPLQSLLIFIIIILSAFPILKRNYYRIVTIMFSVVLFSSIRFWHKLRITRQEKFVVLNTRGASLFGLVLKNKLILYSNDISPLPSSITAQVIQPFMYNFRLDHLQINRLPAQSGILITHVQLKILQLIALKKHTYLPSVDEKTVIILSQNNNHSLEQIYQLSGCSFFVADGSNALWKIQQWKKEAELLHLRFHSVPEQGAFLLDRNQFNSPETVFAE